MADSFIVRLPRDPAQQPSCVRADARGQLRSAVADLDVDAPLPPEADGARVVLVVPGAEVLSVHATLPAGSESRLAQVVPFALEEQVAEDIETLHFALGTRRGSDAAMPVAVVARERLDGWLAQAAAWGLVPQAVYADSELVPVLPGHVTALLDAGSLVVRREDAPPVVVPSDDLALGFELAFGTAGSEPADDVMLYVSPREWQRHGPDIDSLRARFSSLKVQLLAGGVLGLLAQGVAQASPANLLQGEYRPRTAGAGSFRDWRLAAVLAAAAFLLHVGGKAWELQRLSRAERAADAAIADTFRAATGEQNATNARRRLEERLRIAGGSGGRSGDLLNLLSALAAARDAAPGSTVQALDYRRGTLELRMVAADAASLERMNEALRGAGLAAEVTSGSAREGGYEGRVQLRSAGS